MPVLCGCICLECKAFGKSPEKLASPCYAGKSHSKILFCKYKCQACDKVADEIGDFNGEECEGSEVARAKQLKLQIECQQRHIEKLMVLKQLEAERARMAELMFQKKQYGFLSE